MAAHHPTPDGVRINDIEDFLGYGIGDDGSTWTRKVRGSWKGSLASSWSPLAQDANVTGHRYVHLFRNGKKSKRYVHRLVLEAFDSPCPVGMECRHKDGNPSNNCVANLRWGTSLENGRDAVLHGTTCRGSRRPAAVLTESDIPGIFRMRAGGASHREIANVFGVSEATISSVLHRRTWKHVVITEEDWGEVMGAALGPLT